MATEREFLGGVIVYKEFTGEDVEASAKMIRRGIDSDNHRFGSGEIAQVDHDEPIRQLIELMGRQTGYRELLVLGWPLFKIDNRPPRSFHPGKFLRELQSSFEELEVPVSGWDHQDGFTPGQLQSVPVETNETP